jgi:hypothetical protein
MNPKSIAANDTVPIMRASYMVFPAIASMISAKNKRIIIPLSIYCVIFPLTKIFLNRVVLTMNSGRTFTSSSSTGGMVS